MPRSPRQRALLYYGANASLTILVLAAIPAIHGFPLREAAPEHICGRMQRTLELSSARDLGDAACRFEGNWD